MHRLNSVGRGWQVYDSWDASPGAKVIAGGLVSTRENRLLNWAKEIEALVHEQACGLMSCARWLKCCFVVCGLHNVTGERS